MTTNIKAIASILDRENVNYMLSRDNSFLFLAIELGDLKDQGIVIKTLNSGKIVQFNAPLLFQISGSVHKGLVMQRILESQFRTPMLKFVCSTVKANKQYIEARVDFPLYESPLRSEDLFSCISFMGAKLTEELPKLQNILDFGCEP
ncbi:MAG: hypothetical protein AAFO95_12740 [Cyanobacteria bacterium J06600_6]